MPLVKRTTKGSPLSIEEMDGNLDYLATNLSGSTVTISGSVDVSGSLSVNGTQVGGSEYTYTEVAITSGSILTMGSSPIELLPAPGVNKYYEYFGYAEYTYNTSQYTLAAGDNLCIVGENSYAGSIVERPFFTGTSNHIFRFGINSQQTTDTTNEDYQMVYKQDLNERVILTTFLGNNPAAGDGTLLVKIWYKVRTFGTEL